MKSTSLLNVTQTYVLRRSLHVLFLGLLLALTGTRLLAQDWKQDDFCRMHGANYVASYTATDVEMWLNYDHAAIDRELGYAEKMGLNCIRVFLQSLVYHHDPETFLARFEDFLATADAHGKLPSPKMDFPNQSSTWAIGPSRTASGKPILFIDPHWPAEGQTSWWEFHVHVGRMRPAWPAWSQLRDHVESVKVIEYRPRTQEVHPVDPANGEPSKR